MRFSQTALSSPGIFFALASAGLFGASTPLAKLFLGVGFDPWLLAALLYLGSGVGLACVHFSRWAFGSAHAEAPLRRADIPWLGLVIVTGGLIAPVLLMQGLALTSASSASLLLNLEGLATMAIAWLVFRENTDRRIVMGAALILAGAIILSWRSGGGAFGWGAPLIALACVAWGIDNNLTRKLSRADPVQIAMVKGIVAGGVNFGLAFLNGAHLPPIGAIAATAAVGFLGYGVSLTLFVLALRNLGSARTGAYFSTAPFIGALLAVVLFHEPITAWLGIAAMLMGIGLWLHLAERHAHAHVHDEMEHEHRHVHDEHHQHEHSSDDPSGEPHTHNHRHAPLVHTHRHFPDLHHRHGHN